VTSITSPEAGKKLRLDPNLLPLIEGRRVVLVDDAISTGATAIAAVRLLQKVGVDLAGMVVAMKQTNRWQAVTAALPVRAVYGCPLFQRGQDGWIPLTETQPDIP
jgi:adenine/guanine phosphoribosyltransferase-like PRPP-binding protein